MKRHPSLWSWSDKLFPSIDERFQFTLGEGHTALEKIELGPNFIIYCKREDTNPTGSIKDRGMAFLLSALHQQGHTKFTISSSGNAAISAAAYAKITEAQLTAFLSPNTSPAKRAALQHYQIDIKIDPRPISSAYRYAKQHNLYNLRPSSDSLGPVGYQTIAFELLKQLPQTTAIFFPVSSATTLLGVAQGYQYSLQEKGSSTLAKKTVLPQFHAVQTTKTNTIANYFDPYFTPSESSLADGLVAKIVPRQTEVIEIIKQSQGSGWVVNDHQILQAHKRLLSQKIQTSYEGAAAFAGILKAQEANWSFSGPIVCLLTGSHV